MHKRTTIEFSHQDKRLSQLRTSQWVPAPLEEVFEFFSRPENLQRLTPDSLHFEIKTPQPIHMEKGLEIEYKLKIHGIPLYWRSLISDFSPPHSFTDEQLKGPYKTWVHTHQFKMEAEGTRIEDSVLYQVPLGRVIEKMLVQKNLHSIFTYRHRMIDEMFRGKGTEPASTN